jgi:hypothetical protein
MSTALRQTCTTVRGLAKGMVRGAWCVVRGTWCVENYEKQVFI